MKFDLGPHVASLVMSTPLSVHLFRCGEGGSASFGTRVQGPLRYEEVISLARHVPTKTKTEEAEAKPRTSQAKTSTSKDKGTSRTKDEARQGKPRQAQAKFKLQEETFTSLCRRLLKQSLA